MAGKSYFSDVVAAADGGVDKLGNKGVTVEIDDTREDEGVLGVNLNIADPAKTIRITTKTPHGLRDGYTVTVFDVNGPIRLNAVDYFVKAGASADGDRVKFPRGMCREIIKSTAPKEFTQFARNPKNNVQIGGNNTVLVPAYGPPFVYSKEGGRRYANIEDFRNFVKLAYMSPNLHHSGGTVCEPVDLPVNKRHFDMNYSHIKYSDKAFMGSVTQPDRAEDTVDMARISNFSFYIR